MWYSKFHQVLNYQKKKKKGGKDGKTEKHDKITRFACHGGSHDIKITDYMSKRKQIWTKYWKPNLDENQNP